MQRFVTAMKRRISNIFRIGIYHCYISTVLQLKFQTNDTHTKFKTFLNVLLECVYETDVNTAVRSNHLQSQLHSPAKLERVLY